MNRDIKLLQEVSSIMALADETEQRMNWEHDKIMNITPHLTGMPGGGGLPKGIDDALCSLHDAEQAHMFSLRRYTRAIRRADEIVHGIENAEMRAFVVMRYLKGMTDVAVRRELKMSEYALKAARECVESAERMDDVKWTGSKKGEANRDTE